MTPTEAQALAARLREGITPGPWQVHPEFSRYVVPADHAGRAIGGAVDDAYDRDYFAHQIALTICDRHCRGDYHANARLIAAAPELLDAIDALAARAAELEGYRRAYISNDLMEVSLAAEIDRLGGTK